ncbi:MAG: signal recognition particle-docking protein FtsY [Oleiphilaceae bacterium]|nr:signal recognition particle-docking protein FtsY [Oleiphilaceae bacterium]
MQAELLYSLVALGLIGLVIIVDLVRARGHRPQPKDVPQIPHQVDQPAKALTPEKQVDAPAPAAIEPAQKVVSEPEMPAPVAEAPPPAIETETPAVPEAPAAPEVVPEPEEAPSVGFFGRIKSGLSRTRSNLTEGLSNLLLGQKEIDDELLEDIETQLLSADVGIEATTQIVENITEQLDRKTLKDASGVQEALRKELSAILTPCEAPLKIESPHKPFVILVVGVNGVGKTTTIGKMAKRFQSEGKSVMLAAGDTFRAAAVEQLQVWGERNQVPVVAQHTGADSASVIYDAVESAQSRGIDVVIADTAGRLQNKDNLMSELEKVVRVMRKLDDTAPHEVMLVLDAGTGQNALSQAQVFQQAVGVSGISLTKLDGTAKGGVIFAIAKQLQLPIRFIGVGEQIDDLRPFEADQFIEALFSNDAD